MRPIALLLLMAWAAIAPAVEITYASSGTGVHASLDGATVKGKINARVEPCAAPGVKFYLDGAFKNVEGGCPYDYGGDNFLIDTAAIADGAHTIEAREGNAVIVRAKAVFTVANIPPPVCVIPPVPPVRLNLECPAGTVGHWLQTKDCVATCGAADWTCGPWKPATPSAAACPPVVLPRPLCAYKDGINSTWNLFASDGGALPDKVFFGWFCRRPDATYQSNWRAVRIAKLKADLANVQSWDLAQTDTEWLAAPPTAPTADEQAQADRFLATRPTQ